MKYLRVEATASFLADTPDEEEAVKFAFEQACSMYGSVFAKNAIYRIYKEE